MARYGRRYMAGTGTIQATGGPDLLLAGQDAEARRYCKVMPAKGEAALSAARWLQLVTTF